MKKRSENNSIQEKIPNPDLEDYLSSVDDFKYFVELRETNLFVDNADAGILTIMPQNSVYSDQENNTEIRTISNFTGITNVNFSISGDVSIENIVWIDSTPGSTIVSLTFKNGTVTLTDSRNVDLTQNTMFQFLISTLSNQHIDFEIEEEFLEISNLRYNTTLTTTLAYGVEEPVALVNVPVTIAYPEFGITKSTTPRIM